MTRVFGRDESENKVMDHSREPLELVLDQIANATKTMSFWRVSAAMNLKFIAYGLLVDMKWKERRGTANKATNRLMPEHWSGLKIFHHFIEP